MNNKTDANFPPTPAAVHFICANGFRIPKTFLLFFPSRFVIFRLMCLFLFIVFYYFFYSNKSKIKRPIKRDYEYIVSFWCLSCCYKSLFEFLVYSSLISVRNCTTFFYCYINIIILHTLYYISYSNVCYRNLYFAKWLVPALNKLNIELHYSPRKNHIQVFGYSKGYNYINSNYNIVLFVYNSHYFANRKIFIARRFCENAFRAHGDPSGP